MAESKLEVVNQARAAVRGLRRRNAFLAGYDKTRVKTLAKNGGYEEADMVAFYQAGQAAASRGEHDGEAYAKFSDEYVSPAESAEAEALNKALDEMPGELDLTTEPEVEAVGNDPANVDVASLDVADLDIADADPADDDEADYDEADDEE